MERCGILIVMRSHPVPPKPRVTMGKRAKHQVYARLLTEQEGLCAICGTDGGMTLFLDHDHVSGEPRGLLCHACNWRLGHIEGWLRGGELADAITNYLARTGCVFEPPADFFHPERPLLARYSLGDNRVGTRKRAEPYQPDSTDNPQHRDSVNPA